MSKKLFFLLVVIMIAAVGGCGIREKVMRKLLKKVTEGL